MPVSAWWCLLVLAVGCAAQGTANRGQPPASPCPAIYSYGWEPSGWHGIITIIPPARFSEAQLVLRMTVPYYRPEAGVGRIEIKGGTAEVEAISRRAYRGERHQVQFMIIFPPFDDLPRVKEIIINGKTFCTARQVFADTRSTIELKYALKTDLHMPLANGNAFSVAGNTPSMPGPAEEEEVIYVVQGQNGTYVIEGSKLTSTNTSTSVEKPSVRPPLPSSLPPPVEPQIPASTRPPPRPKPPTTPRPTTTTTPVNEVINARPSAEESDEFQVNGLNCGVPTPPPNALVLNGLTAIKGQWPWQAAMFKTSSTGLTFQCGGTLVSHKHVITAGHCVYVKAKQKAVPVDTLLIYLGKHNLRSWTEPGQVAKDIEQIIIHPNYGKNNYDFDLAILVFSSTVEFSEFVKPVCLWDKSSSLDTIINEPGMVVGWGRDEHGDTARELKFANMPVVTQETCLRSDPFFTVLTNNATYCAGYRNGTSVCNGDSGGGMFFYLDNPKQHVKTWYTRGVVSISKVQASEQLCDDRSYVVFTDLAKLLPWVRQQL